jgi:ABC-type bacteriocin/lantibiotic exporter with double-glycine peptidase domain
MWATRAKFLYLKIYLKSFRLLKPWRVSLILSTVFGLFVTSIGLLPAFLMKLIFDHVYPLRSLMLLNLILASILVIYLLQFLLDWALGLIRESVSMQFSMELKKKIFHQLCFTPVEHSARISQGDLLVRINSDVERFENMMIETSQTLFHQFFKLVITFSFVLMMDPGLVVFVLIALPLYVFEMKLFNPALGKLQNDQLTVQGKIMGFLKDRFAKMILVKTTQSEKQQVENYSGILKEELDFGLAKGFLRSMAILINSLSAKFLAVILCWYLGHQVVTGQLSIGELAASVALLGYLVTPLTTLVRLFMNWQIDIVSIRRIDELLSDLDSELEPDSSPIDTLGHTLSLELKNISYEYNPKQPVLNDVTVNFSGPGIYLLTGENGSGKTTLLEIILKLRRDYKGSISINGQNLKQISSHQLRRLIAFVPQDEYTLSATVKDNLLLGNNAVNPDFFNKTIKLLGLEYLTEQNKIITSEDDLSLGQRQRLALARAVLSNKPIIIMDEPTSSLDPLMEKDLRDYLLELSKSKMIIIVSHNQHFKSEACKIFHFKNGSISNEGLRGALGHG